MNSERKGRTATFLLAMISGLLCAACGGGGGGGGSGSGGGGGGTDPLPSGPPRNEFWINFTGWVEKGPLVAGSDVKIFFVRSDGTNGDLLTEITTDDNLGYFRGSAYTNITVRIQAAGRFLDEVDGSVSSLPVRLNAMLTLNKPWIQWATVNILTHMAEPRATVLMAAGESAKVAQGQSQDELMAALAPIMTQPDIPSFSKISQYKYAGVSCADRCAYLLALSALFMERSRQLAAERGTEVATELQSLLDSIAGDLRDGILNDTTEIPGIREASRTVDPEAVTRHLSDLAVAEGSTTPVAELEDFLDSDLDGIVNNLDSDDDNDGIDDTQDAYRLDPAASVDSDGDGYPNAWNPGMTSADSTTGLVLDSYPDEQYCWLPEHGDGTTCDFRLGLPDYVPTAIDMDDNGIIYLLSPDNMRIFRWDAVAADHLYPLTIGAVSSSAGAAPTSILYHPAHSRLYLGYDNGDVTYFDLPLNGDEQRLMTLAVPVYRIADAGNFLLVHGDDGSRATPSIYDRDGGLRDTYVYSVPYASVYDWNPLLNRIYFAPDDSRGYFDLYYAEIDPASGGLVAVRHSRSGSYRVSSPVSVSPDGGKVLVGSGDIYDANDLIWLGATAGNFVDAEWLSQDSTLVLRDSGGRAQVERRDAAGNMLEIAGFDGAPLAMFALGSGHIVVTERGHPQFYTYIPSNDSDGDGISNTLDAYPTDPAASVDSDNDGYPDAWNPGMTEFDSTTGLLLDPYPADSACFLPEHGDGVSCDIASAIPEYAPTFVDIDDNGVVYLLSPENHRVYRWDSATGSHLNPIVPAYDRWPGGSMPVQMIIHMAHSRIYLGYDNGVISYFDLGTQGPEQLLTRQTAAIEGLAAVGNFVLVQVADDFGGNGSWRLRFTYDSAGVIRDRDTASWFSPSYEWNPILGRVYFFQYAGTSQSDLYFAEIDQSTGHVGLIDDIPSPGFNGTIGPPIRLSADSFKILLGSGEIFSATDLGWLAEVQPFEGDAAWLDDGRLVVARQAGPDTTLEVLDAAYVVESSTTIQYPPVATLKSGNDIVVVTRGPKPVFEVVTP